MNFRLLPYVVCAPSLRCAAIVIWVLLLSASGIQAEKPAATNALDGFNYIAGTQTFGPAYQFTEETKLSETADAIFTMGSNVLKFGMSSKYVKFGAATKEDPSIHSLTELASTNKTVKRVFAMPFARYVIWTYAFSTESAYGVPWTGGFTAEKAAQEHKEIYEFTRHLLQTYNQTGKTFYLGHWEGDWHLLSGAKDKSDKDIEPSNAAIEGMTAWLNTRQRAIDDAKRDTPHENVQVYHYTEVNLVQKALRGKKTLANTVLPNTEVDFVSYSSYDSISPNKKTAVALPAALDYLEAKLKPKPQIQGRRVFIGEYGAPSRKEGFPFTVTQQRIWTAEVLATAIEWGVPMALYWQMYSGGNSQDKDAVGYKGYWLIDDHNVPQPVYQMHQEYFAAAKAFVAESKAKAGRVPSDEEFRAWAAPWFAAQAAADTVKR
jgi:hypothetical protein